MADHWQQFWQLLTSWICRSHFSERTHLARSPQVLKSLEYIRDSEDEMGQTERRRLSRRYDSGV
ncbi:uncharacterized protein LOC117582291 isoform X2 [Drosophila guanche]|uniref:uncharacterized protein LOC117582291 isoform X2 n=1 Tax=Drosophila guanche TaxID=7266 RepID=UPI00147204AD|nr:uncharacterized protein LOC117582291 isoform X2 [Drosophila guanche]